jgi:DNA-binding response OmpR family regulator
MSERRIMLVDDDESVRTLVRMTLPRGDGFQVVEAASGDEALESFDEAAPDAVVLDWRMPGQSGADVLAELKRRRPGLPVLVLTGEHDAKPRAVAESLGADAFLTKPFSPLQLIAELERLVRAA